MGSTLTHKTIVVELALSGLTTEEANLRIIHTPEAIGSYLRTLDQVLILLYLALPETPMGRVTGHSHLRKEHLTLEQKRFPIKEQLATYLGQKGAKLDEVALE